MFGHQVIEDFKEILRQGKDPIYVDSVRLAIEDIREAQHFYLGAYQELVQPLKSFALEQKESQVFLGASSRYVHLPYQSCWFEFEDESYEPGSTIPVPKRGLLVHELDSDLFRVVISNWVAPMRRWVLNPQSYLVVVGRTFREDRNIGPRIAAAAAERGAPPALIDILMNSNVYPMPSMEKLSWEKSLGLRADDQRDLFVLNAALLLLNCKNVSTKDNLPSQKLNKKRAKSGKQELLVYKTLTLMLPATQESAKPGGKGGDSITRMHLCRGHFKIFTDAAPLFGRHTGLYWWAAHVRGEKVKGLVAKDYAVELT